MVTYTKIPFSLGRFIFYFLKPYKWRGAWLLMFTAYLGMYASLEPLSLKWIIDDILKLGGRLSISQLAEVLTIFIAVRVIHSLSAFGIDTLLGHIHPNLRKDIALQLFSNLLYHTEEFYQEELAGSLASKVSALQEAVKNVLDNSRRIFCFLCEITFACISTSFLDPIFIVVILGWTSVFVIFGLFFSSRLNRLAYSLSESDNVAFGRIVDSLSNIFTVKIFRHYDYEYNYLSKYLRKVETEDRKFRLLQAKSWIVLDLFCLLLALGMIVFLIRLMSKTLITPGDFTFIVMISSSLSSTVFSILEQFEDFINNIGSARQSLKVFSEKLNEKEIGLKEPLLINQGSIEFSQVDFSYGRKELFQDINIKINKGETVGLVGVSGSGKSTFVKLILRLLSPQKGKVMIDETDLENCSQESIMKAISFINQEPILFHRSIKENILYGNVNATEDKIILAAKRAHIHSFIEKLPEGYDTLVGEKGVKLSGGQRQRIAIARAFLKDSRILIMDEATSSLDSITENEIQNSLRILTKNKTCLVIAHRLSTISTLQRIIVFDKGKIVAEGNHKELLKKSSLYKELWKHSINGLLPNNFE